ncbi:MAG: hypothetical protein RLZZ387_566 [Chloroflexota bacterium]|jgi:type I restriction enzyme S subunit
MSIDLLLAHFETIAEAPGGVARLRQLILQLAVQGQLVPQYLEDEPASILLQKARSAKARLGVTTKVLLAESILSALPATWTWTTLAELGLVNPRNNVADDQEVAFVPMTLVPQDYGVPVQSEVRPWHEVKKGFTHFAEGDVVLAKITPCFQNGKAAVMRGLRNEIGAGTTELHVFRPVENTVLPEYVYIYLKSPNFVNEGIPRMTGTAGQKRVPNHYFALHPFPLPPLAEQRRIVERVNQLMALCDDLEARQARQHEERQRLGDALTDDLLAARESDGVAAAWARLRDAFDVLYDAPESVAKLRQAILQLAVQGRLVEQDPADEPAIIHMEAFHREARPLLIQRKVRGLRPEREIREEEISHPIPAGWALTTVESACSHIVDCLHSTPIFTPEGFYCIDTNCISQGVIHFDKARKVSRETFTERTRRLLPVEGDVLFSREGTIGISVVVPRNVNLCLGQRMMMYRPQKYLDSGYFVTYLSSPFFLGQILHKTTGTAAKHVNIGDIRKMPLLVPPLAEQRRIVERVNQLMALCDDLETKLREERAAAERAAEALCAAVAAGRSAGTSQVKADMEGLAEAPILLDIPPRRTPVLARSLDDYAVFAARVVQRHQGTRSSRSLGHVKLEKIAHLAECCAQVDLGRRPQRKPRGPADFDLLKQVIERGRELNAFDAPARENSEWGYQFVVLPELAVLSGRFGEVFGAKADQLTSLIDLLVPLKSRSTEIVATLYAVWNDLLRAGLRPDDAEILDGFRAFHPAKEHFETEVLMRWLSWMREQRIVPTGAAKPTLPSTTSPDDSEIARTDDDLLSPVPSPVSVPQVHQTRLAFEAQPIEVPRTNGTGHHVSDLAQSSLNLGAAAGNRDYALLREMLVEQGTLTNGAVQEALGIDAAAARELLRQLVTDGLARVEGQKRGTKYVRVQ